MEESEYEIGKGHAENLPLTFTLKHQPLECRHKRDLFYFIFIKGILVQIDK